MMYEIVTVNKKLKFVISIQETNLSYDTTFIKLYDMLRNKVLNYVITQNW